jgi:hypothetical protein
MSRGFLVTMALTVSLAIADGRPSQQAAYPGEGARGRCLGFEIEPAVGPTLAKNGKPAVAGSRRMVSL